MSASVHSRIVQHNYGQHEDRPHPDCPMCEIEALEAHQEKIGLGTESMGRLTDLRSKYSFYLERV